jgi:predicted nucleic acid-binding protein
MSLYMIDTQVLQFALLGPKLSSDPRASGVQDWLIETKKEHNIAISALVLSEFLAQHPPDYQTNILGTMTNDWMILPYNSAAARKFGELRYVHVITRQGLSIDTMILAHAIAVGAEALFTLNEADFTKLALNRIAIRTPIPLQGRLNLD